MKKVILLFLINLAVLYGFGQAQTLMINREFHVSVDGNDANDGTSSKPLQSISAAAERAMPGDVITVHAGVYREQITPPRGGNSAAERIVYQAAPGEKVVIKGSEIIKGWKKVSEDT